MLQIEVKKVEPKVEKLSVYNLKLNTFYRVCNSPDGWNGVPKGDLFLKLDAKSPGHILWSVTQNFAFYLEHSSDWNGVYFVEDTEVESITIKREKDVKGTS